MKTQLMALMALMTGLASGALTTIQTDLAALGNGYIAPTNPFLIGTTEVTFVDSNGTTDLLLVVDSSVGLPADPDLLISPTHIGWGLAIQENPGAVPDDEARGGSIDLAFLAPEPTFSWQYGDTEEGTFAVVIQQSGATMAYPTLFTGDAGASAVQTFSDLADPAVGIRYELGGSGMVAIHPPGAGSNCVGLSCIPEPSSSFLLGCLGFVSVIGRRARR